jgi:hypothetical protein
LGDRSILPPLLFAWVRPATVTMTRRPCRDSDAIRLDARYSRFQAAALALSLLPCATGRIREETYGESMLRATHKALFTLPALFVALNFTACVHHTSFEVTSMTATRQADDRVSVEADI